MKYNPAFTRIMSLDPGKKKADCPFLHNTVDMLSFTCYHSNLQHFSKHEQKIDF